ncbi:hypothetical protein LOCC1_G001256 [Lachnellula occidentalis]|uniref:HAUS augmin-like complex subunit 6 N-terminal domain-containing protein n=1 Tax=Lachnellula occidentalis TaxID=215460 RepID=A0A8H8S9G6_9HELO|nr:hypothetical protein LOCC1_G001256 [Lachnellula occidentalis]
MFPSTTNPAVARTRTQSLRVPPSSTLKPIPAAAASSHSSQGISNVSLFLTNLRLLDLDLRKDWPDITNETLSTKKDAQQNQKKRIQCKLQPFFPPLEPLQSLNLRAALFRSLDHAKKTGVLGRDTLLRKTMLDECKGERLEEVLAVFSNVVLKKVLVGGGLELEAIAMDLAFENFSYSGERTLLSTLILAHKASLGKHLNEKNQTRARYQDFSDLLKLNERRITRRHEQLKEVLKERASYDQVSPNEVGELQDQVQKNWSGNEQWLDTVLHGDSRVGEDGLLATRFDKIWKHVENGSIGDMERKERVGLLEQLDARVKDQESRLARWQDFGKTLSKNTTVSPSTKELPAAGPKKIDLGFNRHESLQVGRSAGETVNTTSDSLEEYNRIIENMKSEIAAVRKPRSRASRPRQSLTLQKRTSLLIPQQQEEANPAGEQDWSSASASASETEELSAESNSFASKSISRTPPSEPEVAVEEPVRVETHTLTIRTKEKDGPRESMMPPPPRIALSPSPLPPARTPSPQHPPKATESDLADDILNCMAAASPSPKKARHTLSLAERTRLSMARPSHSQYSSDDDFDMARLSIKPRQSMQPRAPEPETDLHAGLIERTRKSMAGFEAAQKKAQMERRRSVKDAKKKQRESTFFPRVEEEEVNASAIELIEGDPDYESVFKSRPKIATSPAVSPIRGMEEEDEDVSEG